jgi:N-methylhydantoinase A
MSTTVLDAYIRRQVVRYVSLLSGKLAKDRFRGQLLIVSSSGVMGVHAVKEKAIATFTSGPIGGVSGALSIAERTGIKDWVTMDVGGTSFDVSLIRDHAASVRHQSELMGYPVLLPGMDIRPIGAGGGSIARVDAGGMLTVGPESAGAYPGPMCYGLGGKEPTVTDAALVNGWIDPDYFLGGEIKLDMDRARSGVGDVAEKLGLSVARAADGILAVAQNNMTTATREILVGQGHDPRDFTLMSYGGGGGLFAAGIARDLSISRVLIPPNPGVFSAWGMLSTDIVHAFAQTHARSMDAIDVRELTRLYRSMESRGHAMLSDEEMPDDSMEFVRSVDMCYEGQGHYVEVPVPGGDLEEEAKAVIISRFHALHRIRYGHQLERIPKTINIRVKAKGKTQRIPAKEFLETRTIPDAARKPERRVFFGQQFTPWKILERAGLVPGNAMDGPAIVEEPHHTTIVYPGQIVRVDRFKNLVIEI